MRTTIFYMFLLLFLACTKVTAQKIVLFSKDTPFKSVIQQVQKQSGYSFAINDRHMRMAKTVTISAQDKDLKEVLNEIFSSQPFGYIIDGKVIISVDRGKEPQRKTPLEKEQEPIKGKVSNEKGEALAGASVRIKGTTVDFFTDANGRFEIPANYNDAVLQVSYIGYARTEISAREANNIVLNPSSNSIDIVDVVSTGYQTLPKERSTGSFVQIDNELLERRVSTDILNRLENTVPGLAFKVNKTNGKTNEINIRGRSTIFANDQPLIVLDNFPYDGDLNNINPNDIESVTILKDAAAASIWGARAGNGVIVLTTKKGVKNTPTQINFNGNLTVGEKPDLYYSKRFLNSPDFIDVEQKLFDQNYYNSDQTNANKPVISPVVEILLKKKNGVISDLEAQRQIDYLKNIDVRDDFARYFYRASINQQYSLNFNGGSKDFSYFISGGYDKNLLNTINNDYNRITLNAQSTISPLKNLELLIGINYSNSKTSNNNAGYNTIFPSTSKSTIYPYAQLADENGMALPIVKDYRGTFTDEPGNGLLDWKYRPLDELNLANNTSKINNTRINLGAKYTFIPQLSAEIKYQYEKQFGKGRNLYDQQTYFTRDLINRFYNPLVSNKYPVPLGSILDQSLSDLSSYSFRSQLNYNQNWSNAHQLTAIGGIEVREVKIDATSNRLYGYNDDIGVSSRVDYTNMYPAYYNPATRLTIPFTDAVSGSLDRFFSYYANAAYTYNNKYTISASARKDASNLFGVKTNQRGVPLYSIGTSWIVSNEKFYSVEWLPYLKLRATFGYNGNVDKSTSAYITASYSNSSRTNLPRAQVVNPPNPNLIWERTKILNLGLDFSTKNRRIAGSLEYFSKSGIDLIGTSQIASSNGITSFRSNIASTKGNGTDITINTKNLVGSIHWNTSFLFSYSLDKVTRYEAKSTSQNYVLLADNSVTPFEGKPLFSIYSYKWAGLDPSNGDPQGILDGEVSKNYAGIISGTKPEDLVYNGPASAPYFGSLRNSLGYKNLEISFTLSYKLGHYFRKESINYEALFRQWGGHSDYSQRWQKPGDEKYIQIPSLPLLPNNVNRDNLYTGSENLVESASHIRFQDIAISYSFDKKSASDYFFRRIELYGYINNLGLIWKNNKSGIDPDAGFYFPLSRTYSIGVKCAF